MNALAASAPNPEFGDRLALFGQFLGDWEFEGAWHHADGSSLRAKGEWSFSWILDGRAIQDVWMAPSREERRRTGAPLIGYGTAVRCYDPGLDAWRVTWNGVLDDGYTTILIARAEGEGILLEGKDAHGNPMRWQFSQIAPTSFRWQRFVTKDGGKTWPLELEMRARRAAASR